MDFLKGTVMKQKPRPSRQRMSIAYPASVPAQVRAVLEELRRTITAAAPMARERIRYGMPAFRYHGPLVFFAAFKNHLGFYGVSKEVLDTFSSELA